MPSSLVDRVRMLEEYREHAAQEVAVLQAAVVKRNEQILQLQMEVVGGADSPLESVPADSPCPAPQGVPGCR